MDISKMTITIRELINGYAEKGFEGEDGIVAYGGLLDVRPAYQREFVYNDKERDEVIRSVAKDFPLNVMYWAKLPNGRFELMDGQQRTISICRYFAEGYQTFAVDNLQDIAGGASYYAHNIKRSDEKRYNKLLNYDKLDIYICEGTPNEIHEWFKVINIAVKTLTPQEMLNTSYTGEWLYAAKHFFSRHHSRNGALIVAGDYISGSPIRQQILETALKWIADAKGLSKIEDYMARHHCDKNADEIINYFKAVFEWVEKVFTVKRKELMRGLEWGLLYNKHKDDKLNPIDIEEEIKRILIDCDNDYGVTNKAGVYEYILTQNEKYLQIRDFRPQERQQAYERQNHCCGECGKHFELSDLHAHHIKRWVDGGHTTADNCALLCADCHHSIHRFDKK